MNSRKAVHLYPHRVGSDGLQIQVWNELTIDLESTEPSSLILCWHQCIDYLKYTDLSCNPSIVFYDLFFLFFSFAIRRLPSFLTHGLTNVNSLTMNQNLMLLEFITPTARVAPTTKHRLGRNNRGESKIGDGNGRQSCEEECFFCFLVIKWTLSNYLGLLSENLPPRTSGNVLTMSLKRLGLHSVVFACQPNRWNDQGSETSYPFGRLHNSYKQLLSLFWRC